MNTNDFTYTVKRRDRGHYEVLKWGDAEDPLEVYDVIIPYPNSDQGIWCGCQGFKRQTYPKPEHKHIRLVRDFIKSGEPQGRVYRLDGNTPVVVSENNFVDDPNAFDPSN